MTAKYLAIAVAVLALVAVPFTVREVYYVNVASQILFYAIFALGLNVLVGYAGLVSLGHAGLFGLACYGAAILLAAGSGHAVAIAPTAAIAPDATMRKSRRVGSPWAPAGTVEEAIGTFAPLGRRNRLKSHALFKASSVAGSVLIEDRPEAQKL